MKFVSDTSVLPVQQNNRQLAMRVAKEKKANHNTEAFYVLNCDTIIELVERWNRALPQVVQAVWGSILVQPFYALKANRDPVMLQILGALGCGFECASVFEIDAVLEASKCSVEDIMFATVYKPIDQIASAAARNIQYISFDSEEELDKLKTFHPEAKLLIRIMAHDMSSITPLFRFGTTVKVAERLLEAAQEKKMSVVGICFHVGCGAQNKDAWAEGISNSAHLFDLGKSFGHEMNLLNIGGGFVSTMTEGNTLVFEDAAVSIKGALEQYFPAERKVRVIAEPGRFFASAPMALSACVIATKNKVVEHADGSLEEQKEYIVSDGAYGSFRAKDIHVDIDPQILIEAKKATRDKFVTKMYGPTGVPIDIVLNDHLMKELFVNDWIYFDCLGHYTLVVATTLCGFPIPKTHRFISENAKQRLEEVLRLRQKS